MNHKWIKILIWMYVVFLILEGAMRKWWMPSLSNPILIIRDPILLAIYALALVGGVFPINGWVITVGALAGLSAIESILAGQTNLLVTAYGLRINYLHLPLIWVMASVFTRKDVERIGAFLLLVAIPMTCIMVVQFRSAPNAYINRGVGGEELGQIFGADGRIRPPGLFSFITGPQLFYPLVAAFFFDQLSGRKHLPWYLLIVCGLAIAVALPVSISRTVLLMSCLVGLVFVVTLPLSSSRLSGLFRPILLLVVLAIGLSFLPVFEEGRRVFMMRWEQAAYEAEGQAWGSLADRILLSFSNTIYFVEQAPMFGHGIGVGSNVGSQLLSGSLGFALAEEEWGKIILELGPLLGFIYIFYRIGLTIHLGLRSWEVLRNEKNALPLLIWVAMAMTIAQGQWAPPTVLGFSVIGAGLILAAMNPDVVVKEPEEDESIETELKMAESILAEPSHAPLPTPSDRRPPIVVRPVQK